MIPIPLNGRRVPPLSNLVEGDPQRPPVYSVPSDHCKGYKKDSKIQNCHRKSSFNDCPQVVVPHENLWGVSRCNCETAIPWHTRPEVWTTFSERNDLATSLTHWQLNLFTRDILLWTWIPICVPKYVSKWSRALVTRILPENCHGVILKSLLNLGDPQSLPFHCLLRNTEARIHKHDLLKFAM